MPSQLSVHCLRTSGQAVTIALTIGEPLINKRKTERLVTSADIGRDNSFHDSTHELFNFDVIIP